jgi:hypothetical protein
MQKHGLLSFIIHPDYVVRPREQNIFKELLAYLVRLKEEKGVWTTTPSELNRWWRQRAEMSLVEEAGKWRIAGAGHERARVAYASEEDGRLVFKIQGQ